jgi:addiction module RelE/StbE family toxin
MRLVWTARAERDLIEIARYIAHDSPRAALEWVERLRGRARDAVDNPLVGRVVPELGQTDVRELVLRDYRIVYRAERERIVVLTVFEGHRQFRG